MFCHLAMRRVLHLKMVTQCAMLEDFGIFLVLADKVRDAIDREIFFVDEQNSLSLRTIWKHLFHRRHKVCTPPRPLKNLMAPEVSTSSVLAPYTDAHLWYTWGRSMWVQSYHSWAYCLSLFRCRKLESVFRVLEPVFDNINERVNPPAGFASRLGFRAPRAEWFRIYRVCF